MLAPWVIEEMKDVDLKDKRLNERFGVILDQLAGHFTTQFVCVADSEADIYELLQESQQAPRTLDWIVRGCQNRALQKGAEPEEIAENHLRERVQSAAVLFTQPISVRGRQATKSQRSRLLVPAHNTW